MSQLPKILLLQKHSVLRKYEGPYARIPSLKFEIWIKQFGIFTDGQGIMRCTGRLTEAELPTLMKHSIMSEKGHHIASLIVQDSHKRVMHGVVKSTLTEMRAWFWIVQGRKFVKPRLHEQFLCGNFYLPH